MHQQSQVDSHPPVLWVTGIQTSALAVDLDVPHEQTLASLDCGQGAPGEHRFRQLPRDHRAFLEVQSREVPEHSWRKNNKTP